MENSKKIRTLKLSMKTVAVLDNKAMQEIKGGRSYDAKDSSCTSGACDDSCRNASRRCDTKPEYN